MSFPWTIENDIGFDAILDQLNLDVPYVRTHLLHVLRRGPRAIRTALLAGGWSWFRCALGQFQMRGEVGIQFRFVHAKRRGLPGGDSPLHIRKFLLRAHRGLRAGFYGGWRRFVKS
ncbi:MAG TPA: hypothetical protein VH114_07720 [Candidatus Acidoferrum sp.]|nr:hypothetical protein [Candidatus Acidoferrum sp.]